MKNRKDLVIVALATFCLTSTLFMIVSTRSQTGNQYDPWMDLDDNGKINILDAIDLSNVYGTSGDPAKSVNVANFPEHDRVEDVNIRFHWEEHMYYVSSWTDLNLIACGNFSRMYVYAHATNFSWWPVNYSIPVYLSSVYWTFNDTDPTYLGHFRPEMVVGHLNMTVDVTQIVGAENVTYLSTYPDYIESGQAESEITVKAPWCMLCFSVPGWLSLWEGWMDLDVTVYLRNE